MNAASPGSSASDTSGRRPPDPRDTPTAIGFLVVSVPLLAVLVWLILGPLKHQWGAIAAGFGVMCAFGVTTLLSRRRGEKPARTLREANTAFRTIPVAMQIAFPVLISAAIVIPIFTGGALWAPLLGMVAVLLLVFIAIGLRWLIKTRSGSA